MVVSLLGVIVAKGSGPSGRSRCRSSGLILDTGKSAASKVTGQFVQEREKAGAHGTGEAAAYEWQIFTGNRDVYGAAFQFVDAAAVADQSYPDGIAVAERRENGNAIFYPVALRLGDGTSLDAGDAAFAQTLGERMERAGELREQIEDLIKGDVGAINRQMRSLDLRLKANPGEAGAIESERAALQAEYEKLTAEAAELEEQLLADVLAYRLPTGEEGQIAVGDLFAFYYPNQMGFWEKVGWFFSHLWRFLSDDPREANMEGGVYPAIFGTFAMTVIMSAFVTPLGVIAAIYLREYAKQGPLVRAVRISVNNLAGVPSIVFGVFGLGFFVYLVGGAIDEWFFADALPEPTFGTGGILWASLTLALLTLPVVIVATEEALGGIPRGIREAALACGASKWQTIQRVVLPGAIPGILTGVILAMARG
ncbi:MAG: phosphate ABC transporter permease PstA [Verrucomicrobiales bacterium]